MIRLLKIIPLRFGIKLIKLYIFSSIIIYWQYVIQTIHNKTIIVICKYRRLCVLLRSPHSMEKEFFCGAFFPSIVACRFMDDWFPTMFIMWMSSCFSSTFVLSKISLRLLRLSSVFLFSFPRLCSLFSLSVMVMVPLDMAAFPV